MADALYDSMAVRTLFEKTKLRNEDIASYEYARFPATESPTVSGTANPVYFDVPIKVASLDTMLALPRGDLLIGYNVYQNIDHTVLAAANGTALISPAHIFDSCSMSMNDNQVQFVNNPGHIYLVDKLINDEAAYLAKEQSLSKFYQPLASDAIGDAQVALNATQLSTDNGGVIYARVPLRDLFSILKAEKFIMGGQVSFRFTPTTTFAKALFSTNGMAGGATGFIRIRSLEIYVPIVRANVEITSDNWARLKKGEPMRFAYEHREYFSGALTRQNAAVENRIQFAVNASRPSAVVGLVQADARQAVDGNNQCGDLYSLGQHTLNMNGEPVNKLLQFSGASRGYVPEYIYYQELSGRNRSNDSAPPLSFFQWKAYEPLLCYDLSHARDEMGHARSTSANLEWVGTLNNLNTASKIHFVVYSHRYMELKNVNGQLTIQQVDSDL